MWFGHYFIKVPTFIEPLFVVDVSNISSNLSSIFSYFDLK